MYNCCGATVCGFNFMHFRYTKFYTFRVYYAETVTTQLATLSPLTADMIQVPLPCGSTTPLVFTVATLASEVSQSTVASLGVVVAVNVCVAASLFANVNVALSRLIASSSQINAIAFAKSEKLYVCQWFNQ
jgi:hypothetical protein